LGKILGVFHGFTETKIGKFDDPIIEEDITGLDISMHDVIFGKHLEGL
jgi:hypothetical protein